MASNDSKIDNKLDYLEDTKSLIRQSMENKGLVVTENTTFREYADLINNIVPQTDQSDADVLPNDMVSGKVAYNDNNKVIGTLNEYSSMSSQAIDVVENNNIVSGSIQTDTRTLLAKNATVTVDIPLDNIDSYTEAIGICDDILGIDETDARQAFAILNRVKGTTYTYEGMGGSKTEISTILNQIL